VLKKTTSYLYKGLFLLGFVTLIQGGKKILEILNCLTETSVNNQSSISRVFSCIETTGSSSLFLVFIVMFTIVLIPIIIIEVLYYKKIIK